MEERANPGRALALVDSQGPGTFSVGMLTSKACLRKLVVTAPPLGPAPPALSAAVAMTAKMTLPPSLGSHAGLL